MAVVDPHTRIRRLIATAKPRLRDAFLAAVHLIRNRFTLKQLADLIEAGLEDRALAQLERALAQLGQVWTETYVDAGTKTAGFLGREIADIVVSFDQVNQRAVEAVMRNKLRMVREFSAQQRAATKQALLDGVKRGLNPREQARVFRDSIGLTAKQQLAVSNYRRALEVGSSDALDRALRDRRFDATAARAIAGEKLSRSQIDKMVQRYEERFIAHRAETIARTEAMTAVHEGADEMYRQAIDDGDLQAAQLIQVWNPTMDSRTRDSHADMDGQVRAVGEPFQTGNGALIKFPGDPSAPANERIRCRCVRSMRILDLGEVAAGRGLVGAALR